MRVPNVAGALVLVYCEVVADSTGHRSYTYTIVSRADCLVEFLNKFLFSAGLVHNEYLIRLILTRYLTNLLFILLTFTTHFRAWLLLLIMIAL